MYPIQFNAGMMCGSNGQSGQGIYTDVIALMASGRIDMRKMVTSRVPLENIMDGMALAGNRVAGKVLVGTHYKKIEHVN